MGKLIRRPPSCSESTSSSQWQPGATSPGPAPEGPFACGGLLGSCSHRSPDRNVTAPECGGRVPPCALSPSDESLCPARPPALELSAPCASGTMELRETRMWKLFRKSLRIPEEGAGENPGRREGCRAGAGTPNEIPRRPGSLPLKPEDDPLGPGVTSRSWQARDPGRDGQRQGKVCAQASPGSEPLRGAGAGGLLQSFSSGSHHCSLGTEGARQGPREPERSRGVAASGDRAEALVKEKPVARAAGGTERSRGRARGPGGRWDPSCWRRGRPPCTAGLVAPERFQLQGATSTLLCLRGLQTSRGSPESEPRRACAGPTARAGSPEAAVSGLSSCGVGGGLPRPCSHPSAMASSLPRRQCAPRRAPPSALV